MKMMAGALTVVLVDEQSRVLDEFKVDTRPLWSPIGVTPYDQ